MTARVVDCCHIPVLWYFVASYKQSNIHLFKTCFTSVTSLKDSWKIMHMHQWPQRKKIKIPDSECLRLTHRIEFICPIIADLHFMDLGIKLNRYGEFSAIVVSNPWSVKRFVCGIRQHFMSKCVTSLLVKWIWLDEIALCNVYRRSLRDEAQCTAFSRYSDLHWLCSVAMIISCCEVCD